MPKIVRKSSPKELNNQTLTILEAYDALLLDLDGTVWESGRPIPAAVESIQQAQKAGLTTVYVTNNASRSAAEVAGMLAAINLDTPEEHVLTSAQSAVLLAREKYPAGTKVLIVGSPALKELADEAGFHVVASVEAEPQVVIHGHNSATGWAELSEAAYALRAGAEYIATNLDTSLPTKRGLAVGNGSMVAAVVSATGIQPTAAGKPEPLMFHQAAHRIGSNKPLAVGDRLDTDLLGGKQAEMDTFYVATGVSKEVDVLQAPKEMQPTYLAADLSELSLPIAQLLPGPQGGFTARAQGKTLVLGGGDSGSTPIQALRSAAAVAWSMKNVEALRAESPRAEEIIATW